MFVVYLYQFLDHEKVYVGLSDNFNFHLELEKKFFSSGQKKKKENALID